MPDQTTSTLMVGTAGTAGKERGPVIPFHFPGFGTVTNPFLTVSFSSYLASSVTTPVGKADLYGLGRRADPTGLAIDNSISVQDAAYPALHEKLLVAKQIVDVSQAPSLRACLEIVGAYVRRISRSLAAPPGQRP